ncbi:MAG: carbonic anhydrase [Bacteroidales bacterium]|nr:carbonic anhydrase [Bacteroidales bacterium]
MKNLLIVFIAVSALLSCNGSNTKVVEIDKEEILDNTILTADQQAKLTPDQVIEILKRGNDDFTQNNLIVRNTTERVRDASLGQYPKAVILSCLDSRVPVEDVFHRGIGDIFVARVAGNIVNPDILGSMEFACKVSGSKLVLVLGHEYCGAIKSAIDDVELGNITTLLDKIKPAVEQSRSSFQGEAKSSNPEFVEAVCHTNVELMVKEIRKQSPILKEMEEKGEIKIIGGVYDMHTGKVDFYENL